MKNPILGIAISSFFLLLAIYFMARPVTVVTNHFATFGKKATGEVLSRSYRTQTIKASNHTKKVKHYKLMVMYKGESKKSTFSTAIQKQMRKAGLRMKRTFKSRLRTGFIRHLITKAQYEKALRGTRVKLLYLESSNRKKGMPKVLLQASVEASFFRKLAFATQGDLTPVVLGLLVGVFSLLGIFLSTIMLISAVQKSKEQPVETSST